MIELIKKSLYRLLFLSGVWLLFRRAARHRIGIVMYHGICESDIGIWTQIPLDKFAGQIKYFARAFTVISLQEALEIIKGDKPSPPHPLVITFDDGFMSNKTLAYPILKKYNLPATIFLTTSFIDKSPRFEGLIKTDYILCLFRRTHLESLDLTDCGFGLISLGDLTQRTSEAYKVSNALKRLSHESANRIIEIIAERLQAELCAQDFHIFASLEWNDVRSLYSDGLILFGAHTHTHEILTQLPPDKLDFELTEARNRIARELAVPARLFAYPNGTIDDFNEVTGKILAGYFDCALTTVQGLNSPGDDLYALKRIAIGNDTAEWKLKLELSGLKDYIYKLKSLLPAGLRPSDNSPSY
jgi:peptidoglycan/xylan/chitin deacetylase (PgdA/CDA1 family)